ncbi:MAG: acetyl-CoA C-acetyltransferase [Candidatus Cloacimonetes bacterium]|nr:acetyl-CoA C-acetyltransferase [Candidatus Cloacimonadota bacterium]
MKKAYIVSACRTAIGSFQGALKDVTAARLGSVVIEEAIKRAGLGDKKHLVDEVNLGCVLQAGQGQGVSRQASLMAGVPVSVPAVTTNILCGSGLFTVIQAARSILSGENHIVVAGGTESMSQAPYLMPKAREGYRMGHAEVYDSMIRDGLWDAFNDYHMGITAENLVTKHNLSREEQDQFATDSQNKAEAAIKAGKFRDEIVPVVLASKKGDTVLDTDEYPRFGCTIESLAKLRPAFKKDGSVTAGNASGINDGASALVVVSEEALKLHNLRPMACIEGFSVCGVEPSVMGIGPVDAVNRTLQRTGRRMADIDLIEANEAFAAQALSVGKELNWDPSLVNVNGGAIALGHPIGASGARILTTLLYEMTRQDKKSGLATLCVGGGMGVALMVSRG